MGQPSASGERSKAAATIASASLVSHGIALVDGTALSSSEGRLSLPAPIAFTV
jgi:hypothetical protein